MIKNILIAGKDVPSGAELADSFALSGCNVTVTGSNENTELTSPEVKTVSWNKGSALSARSVIIQAEANFGFSDTFVLYFDSVLFSEKFNSISQDILSEASDEMLLSYQYLTLEIINRINQHKTKSRLVFVLKSHPTMNDAVKSGLIKKSVEAPVNALVGAHEAAFATFAENIAASLSENEYIYPLLVTGDNQNETIIKDSSFASWLSEYISNLDSKKNEQKNFSWIKAGSKGASVLSIFH